MQHAAEDEMRSLTRGISLPSSLNRQVVAQARREERSVSGLIRYALRRYLAEQAASSGEQRAREEVLNEHMS